MGLTDVLVRLLLAIACGAVLGFEREWRNHSAGLRTHILVCLAAAVLAVIALDVSRTSLFDGSIRMDPMRLIEAVTNGVAFLAAGMIAFTRGRVVGLTTGAGLWLAGVVGLAAGLGLWQIAVLTTVAALVVLSLLRTVEKVVPPLKDNDRTDAPGPDRNRRKPSGKQR